MTSSITWRFYSPYGVSYWCSIGTKSLSPSVFEIFGSKYIGVTNLTFLGHVTSLGMWPFDTPYSFSNRCSIVTNSLSPAVFESLNILGSRPWPFKVTWRHRSRNDSIPHMGFPIGVPLEPSPYLHAFPRYLAPNIPGSRPCPFGGHVTSLGMWPFDTPYSFSYRCSIVTDSLSPAVFEILSPKHIGVTTLTFQGHVTFSRYSAPKCLSNANRHCACAISRDLYPLCKIWVHIWISNPHIAYSLWHFYRAPMKNNGCLLVRPAMLNAKSSDNFLSPKICKFWPFMGAVGLKSTSFEPFCVKIGWGVWPPGVFRKKSQKVTETPIGKTCRS